MALAAQPSRNASEADAFEAFIAKQEKAMDAAQKRLLQAIDKREAAIRRTKLGADAIRASVDSIAEDRKALVADGTLPKSDDLVDAVVACLENYQDVAERIENYRERMADRAVRLDDPASIAKLTALEARLSDILVGRERFTAGSIWVGQRHTNNGNFQLRLAINDLTGSSFGGKLKQWDASRSLHRMVIEGKLSGNRITFHNTQVLRGKDRTLSFQGYVLSDRIITSIHGVSGKGKPVAGWVNLWRDRSARRSPALVMPLTMSARVFR